MELRDQVCSLELAKKLKQLRVKTGTACFFGLVPETLWSVDRFEERFGAPGDAYDDFSAFNVAELGALLPRTLFGKFSMVTTHLPDTVQCGYLDDHDGKLDATRIPHFGESSTEADACIA